MEACDGGNSSLTGELGCGTKPWPHTRAGHPFSSSFFSTLLFDLRSAVICQCVFPGELANNLTGSMVFIDSPSGVLWRLQNWTHKQPIKILPPTSVWTLPFPKWPSSTDAAWVASHYFFLMIFPKLKYSKWCGSIIFSPCSMSLNSPDILGKWEHNSWMKQLSKLITCHQTDPKVSMNCEMHWACQLKGL